MFHPGTTLCLLQPQNAGWMCYWRHQPGGSVFLSFDASFGSRGPVGSAPYCMHGLLFLRLAHCRALHRSRVQLCAGRLLPYIWPVPCAVVLSCGGVSISELQVMLIHASSQPLDSEGLPARIASATTLEQYSRQATGKVHNCRRDPGRGQRHGLARSLSSGQLLHMSSWCA